MQRIKEFINKERENATFKLDYITGLISKYNLNAYDFSKEIICVETEINTYNKILEFIDNVKQRTPQKEEKPAPKDEVVYKDTNEIGWKCFVARKKLGETMQEFSKRFNVDTSAIGKWERGVAHPNRKHYKQIEEIFEMVKTYGQTK